MDGQNHQDRNRFLSGEKLATDTETIIAWLAAEMSYSRDKTKGYEEKLTRLGRPPTDPQSVFGFMGGYWHRFRLADRDLTSLTNQRMADKSLQALAKVVASLGDKVALAKWCGRGRPQLDEAGAGALVFESLDLVKSAVDQNPGAYSPGQLEAFVKSPAFDGNPMGRAILNLHQALAGDDFDRLRDLALKGAGGGVLMLQHYANDLAGRDLSVKMPKPGLGSGDIEPW